MSERELLEAYPNAWHAIAYVEHVLCGPPEPGGQSSWEILVASGLSPMRIVALIAEMLREELKEPVQIIRAEILNAAIWECGTPDFRNYIAGKMGAV